MRLEIIKGMEIRIVNTQVLGLFSNVTFEQRPRSMGLENGYQDGNENCKRKSWSFLSNMTVEIGPRSVRLEMVIGMETRIVISMKMGMRQDTRVMTHWNKINEDGNETRYKCHDSLKQDQWRWEWDKIQVSWLIETRSMKMTWDKI